MQHGSITPFASFKLEVSHNLLGRLDEAQAGIKITGRNINNLRYADDTTLMAESEEELKILLMKVKEESERAGIKINIQKTKIMAPSPTTSWQIDWETRETVKDFIFLGSNSTADGHCSYEIKICSLFGRKAMTNLNSILKSRYITLLTDVHLVKNSFSSNLVWMWELDHKEGWMPRNWCFWTVVLEKTLECSLDCEEIKMVILKETSPEYSLQGLILKLKLQYFSHLMWRSTHWKRPQCWERLKAGGEGDNRRWDCWMASPT